MSDVFISYSVKDKVVADAVVASLEGHDIRCWYAPRDIKPGEDWGEAITRAIEDSKIFLLIFSGHANHSQHVLDELTYAVDEELTILPFRIENLTPKGAMKLHLSARHWLDAYQPSWEAYLDSLVQNIAAILGVSLSMKKEKPEETKGKTPEPQPKPVKILPILIGAVVIILLAAGTWLGYRYLFEPEAVAQISPTPAEQETTMPPTKVPTTTYTATLEMTKTNTPSPSPSPTMGIGSEKVSPADGMTLLYVPEGEFIMGNDEEGGQDHYSPEHNVHLDAFWIDQTEVTNAMFAQFLNAKGNQLEGGATWLDAESDRSLITQDGDEWQPKSDYGDHPVVEVTWYGARAYCDWVGRRLPTEAEWEKSCRGKQGRKYPWGSNYPFENACQYNWAYGLTDCNLSEVQPVGQLELGASTYGCLDMIGNAQEWIQDLYSDTYYSVSVRDNPQGPSSGAYRVLRGGGWPYGPPPCFGREASNPITSNDSTGFRCAADANQ